MDLHIRTVMMKRFLNFVQQIKKSSKKASKFLLESIQHDARSITGSNLRNILLKTDKTSIQDLVPNDVLNIEYHPIQEDENWKVSFIQELIEAKNSNLEVVDFTDDKLDEIMEFLCVILSSPLSFSPFPPSYVSMGFARGPPPVPIIKSGAIQINYLISFCTRK